ncbi:unnamed protein product [Absidia cylindrospora]
MDSKPPQTSVCTCGGVKPKSNKAKKWLKYVIVMLSLSAIYFITKKPSKRLTMTHEEWDVFIKDHPYEAPAADAFRSPCPFLNTFANHGILPRSGNATYDDYYRAMTIAGTTPSVTTSFLNTVFYAYKEINPSQSIWADLHKAPFVTFQHIGQHNILEHDISLSRLDVAQEPDFTIPNAERIQSIIDTVDKSTSIVGEKQLSDFRRKKWNEAAAIPTSTYHFGLFFQFTSAMECVLLLDYLGHDHQISVDHFESFVLKERIPDDWYPLEQPLTTMNLIKRTRSCFLSVRKSKA